MVIIKNTWISYSMISIKQKFINPPRYPSGGNYIFQWRNNSNLQWEVAWIATPSEYPVYQQHPGFYYSAIGANLGSFPNVSVMQRPANVIKLSEV